MPRGNGTGPRGLGAMTGRAAGYCAGFNTTPGFGGGGFGRGGGFGWNNWGGCGGFGRGRRNMFLATGVPGWARGDAALSETDEKQLLANQAQALQAQLDAIQKRQKALEAE